LYLPEEEIKSSGWVAVDEVTDYDFKEVISTARYNFSGGDENLDNILISVMFKKVLPGGIEGTAQRLEYLNATQ
jgi:hypothetical protein